MSPSACFIIITIRFDNHLTTVAIINDTNTTNITIHFQRVEEISTSNLLTAVKKVFDVDERNSDGAL